MATAVARPMTAVEFYDWVHRPENRDRFFELERGEVVEMPPPSKYHGFVYSNVNRILGVYASQAKTGYPCCNDSGIQVESDPDTVRGPDVSYYVDDQTADTMERRYAAPPRLVVEVLSPNDQQTRTNKRISRFLIRGVPLVWLVDPEVRSVTVYRRDRYPVVVDETEELTGEDVLPDFRCRVAELFARPGQA